MLAAAGRFPYVQFSPLLYFSDSRFWRVLPQALVFSTEVPLLPLGQTPRFQPRTTRSLYFTAIYWKKHLNFLFFYFLIAKVEIAACAALTAPTRLTGAGLEAGPARRDGPTGRRAGGAGAGGQCGGPPAGRSPLPAGPRTFWSGNALCGRLPRQRRRAGSPALLAAANGDAGRCHVGRRAPPWGAGGAGGAQTGGSCSHVRGSGPLLRGGSVLPVRARAGLAAAAGSGSGETPPEGARRGACGRGRRGSVRGNGRWGHSSVYPRQMSGFTLLPVILNTGVLSLPPLLSNACGFHSHSTVKNVMLISLWHRMRNLRLCWCFLVLFFLQFL